MNKYDKVLYISGGISKVKDYREIFRSAEMKLRERGYKKIINPAELGNAVNGCFTYDEIVNIDLVFLENSDVLVQLPEWEESRGANIEYGYALGVNKEIASLEELLA